MRRSLSHILYIYIYFIDSSCHRKYEQIKFHKERRRVLWSKYSPFTKIAFFFSFCVCSISNVEFSNLSLKKKRKKREFEGGSRIVDPRFVMGLTQAIGHTSNGTNRIKKKKKHSIVFFRFSFLSLGNICAFSNLV